MLAEDAIKRAIEDYNNKQNGVKKPTNQVGQQNGNFNIQITDDALSFTKTQLQKVENDKKIKIKGIRLSLEEGHCGLMYKVRYIEENENTDGNIVFEKSGLKIFVANDMKDILNGTKIEFKDENLKRGLVFTNPRETGRCNCGKNFFTEK